MKTSLNIFIIGDPHFRVKNFSEGEELIEKCLASLKVRKPDIIVILGDVLDTHEVSRNGPWKQACRFIEECASVAHTFVLIGNHDLINQSQFLTDNHFFIPFKKWDTVTIVDKVVHMCVKGYDLVFSPYVPPGRFEEALDTLESFDWRDARIIFAHQEFAGVSYNGKASVGGDVWDPSYPLVISGHIHKPCNIGNNIMYPGSPLQVAFDESPDKRVWLVSFRDNRFSIEKINLKMKMKKELKMSCSEIFEIDFEDIKNFYIKLKIVDTREQIKIFRKDKFNKVLQKEGVKIVYEPIDIKPGLENESYTSLPEDKKPSFDAILLNIVEKLSPNVLDAYNGLDR